MNLKEESDDVTLRARTLPDPPLIPPTSSSDLY